MSYQVLSRVCRPQNFDQVIGQKAIVRSLRNSILEKKIAHAYLFSGTRGVGKTSLARIFSKVLRCENLDANGVSCGACDGCTEINDNVSINLYEIDGASNNKVENIHDLICDIQTLPSFGKYKIVIIDEVHMLSKSAFNALLKTLEEPPTHIVFIFATTEPWKIPETIISRCLRYDFLSLTVDDLTNYIIKISKNYKFSFENFEVAKKIAILGKGSVRDTLSILDQIRSFNTNGVITEEILAECLGIIKNDDIEQVIYLLLSGNLQCFKDKFSKIILKNFNHKNFVYEIINKIYQLINNQSCLNTDLDHYIKNDVYLDELFFVYEVLVQDMKWALESFDPIQSIEIVFQKICLRRELLNSECKKKKIIKNETDKTWESFLDNLSHKSKDLSSKLEHLYISSFSNSKELLLIILSYDDKSEVFYNYLNQDDEKIKLESYLKSYFITNNVELKFEIKDVQNKLKNINQIKEERRQAELKKIEVELRNDPIILTAKKMFNAEIKKIKLN